MECEPAISDMEEAVRLADSIKDKGALYDYYVEFGRILQTCKRYDDAIQTLENAIRLDPDFSAAYNVRGAARDMTGDLDGALADFGKASPAMVSR